MHRFLRRWRRRVVTLSAYTMLFVVAWATAPAWLLLAALIDLVRRNRFATLRVGCFGLVYLLMEQLGVWGAAALWVLHGGPFSRPTPRWIRHHVVLQRWWSDTLYRAATRLLLLHIEVEGEDAAALDRGPLIVLVRHAGFVDVLLPSAVIANRHGLHLRFVLDRELLWDPCMDIVGHRLGNLFVQRSSRRPEREVRRIAALLDGLGDHEGIAIFPEGARYTPARRQHVLASLERRGDDELLGYARSLRHTLPPKPGGVLGLLEDNRRADVVLFAHAGLDAFDRFSKLMDGTLIGRTIQVRLWREGSDEIPQDPDGQRAWLLGWWTAIDEWIEHQCEVRE